MARTAREVARAVLVRVERDAAYASLALAAALDREALGGPDRGLASELVYGTLRLQLRLDRALAAQTPRGALDVDPETRVALRVAAYQLLFLDRVPAHAAVDDAVSSVRRRQGARLAGFVNAVLRRLARTGEPPAEVTPERDAVAHAAFATATPSWISERLAARYGNETPAVLEALARPAPLWLRANTLRADADTIAAAVATEAPQATLERSATVPEALALRGIGASPASLPAFVRGELAVQDLGAQAIARLLAPQAGQRLLDACAGLGGKTAHLAALLAGTGSLLAVDLSARKLSAAEKEWARLGVRNAAIRTGDLTDRTLDLGPPFDAALLDAPCSGLGVLRRHPELKGRRRPEDIADLAALQARLIEGVLAHVRPGGVLVYGVCTFTEEETTAQIDALLAAGRVSVEPPADLRLARLCDARGLLRTRPDRDDADLFFAARLRVR